MAALTTTASKYVQTSARLCGLRATIENSTALGDAASFSTKVPGISRDIWVKMASTPSEWEDALRLVSDNYRSRGYEAPEDGQLRLTPHHALPDTVVFIAKHQDEVILTMSLIPDNCLLGLPMEILYAEEIAALRDEYCNLVEVTGLADKELNLREFIPVFVTTMKMLAQYALYTGAELFTVAVNPRHRRFYAHVMGFVPFGPLRNYPCVRNHPAEAYMANVSMVRENAPNMYEKLFRHWFAPQDLKAYPLPPDLIRNFSLRSSQTTPEEVETILDWSDRFGSSRNW